MYCIDVFRNKKILTSSWTKTHRERASQRGRHTTKGSADVPREKRGSQFNIKINHLIEHYSSQKKFIQFCCESRVFCILQTGDWKCVNSNVCSVGNWLYLKCLRNCLCCEKENPFVIWIRTNWLPKTEELNGFNRAWNFAFLLFTWYFLPFE